MGRRELFDNAAGRHGVVVARDLRDAEVPTSSFHDWRHREHLAHPHHGVTILPGAPETTEQRLAAAVAGIGDRCAITGWSAAYLRGLRRAAPTTTVVLAPHGASHRQHSGVRVVETTVLDHEVLDTVDGIPVVSGARMLADLARDARLETLTELAIDLRRDGRLAASALDRELARRRRIDLPYASAGVGVECIGLAFHGRAALDRDADRRNTSPRTGGGDCSSSRGPPSCSSGTRSARGSTGSWLVAVPADDVGADRDPVGRNAVRSDGRLDRDGSTRFAGTPGGGIAGGRGGAPAATGRGWRPRPRPRPGR